MNNYRKVPYPRTGRKIRIVVVPEIHVTILVENSSDTLGSFHKPVREMKDVLICYNELIKYMNEFEKKFVPNGVLHEEKESEHWGSWLEKKDFIRAFKSSADKNADWDLKKEMDAFVSTMNDVQEVADNIYEEYKKGEKPYEVPECCNKLFIDVNKQLSWQRLFKELTAIDSELGTISSTRAGKLTEATINYIASKTFDYVTMKEKLTKYIDQGLGKNTIGLIKLHIKDIESNRGKHSKDRREIKFWEKEIKLIKVFSGIG